MSELKESSLHQEMQDIIEELKDQNVDYEIVDKYTLFFPIIKDAEREDDRHQEKEDWREDVNWKLSEVINCDAFEIELIKDYDYDYGHLQGDPVDIDYLTLTLKEKER